MIENNSLPDPTVFRQGLFNLRTRRFGRVAELLIQKMTEAGAARSIFHDLYDDRFNRRIEVKFSTVNAKHEETITLRNLLKVVEIAGRERAVPFDNWRSYEFDANIQQIKVKHFDILYYGLFFAERIVIFRTTGNDILSDRAIGYSDKQHKGNVGEGQFHITG